MASFPHAELFQLNLEKKMFCLVCYIWPVVMNIFMLYTFDKIKFKIFTQSLHHNTYIRKSLFVNS